MKAIVLSDNRSVDTKYDIEHGLSIYLETDLHKLLLDTGASDLFIHNAEKMKIDLREVDYVFISHGHADHIGGLAAFLKLNTRAKVILSANILGSEYYSKRNGLHKISIDIDFSNIADRLIIVEDELTLDDEIHVFANNSDSYPKPLGNVNLFQQDSTQELIQDDFKHELILAVGSKKLFVFTGCAHKGLLNILQTVKEKSELPIRWVMGGFHLLDAKSGNSFETETQVEELATYLKNTYPLTDFITGHCTGEKTYNQLKSILEFRLIHFFTGYQLIES